MIRGSYLHIHFGRFGKIDACACVYGGKKQVAQRVSIAAMAGGKMILGWEDREEA